MGCNTATFADIQTSFECAVNNLDNTVAGEINWDYVDADIHLDAHCAGMNLPVEYPAVFDELVRQFNSNPAEGHHTSCP